MPIVAEVFRDGHPTKLGTFGFEVGPQSGDEILLGNHSYRVVRCRHLGVDAPPGEANLQYQVLVSDA